MRAIAYKRLRRGLAVALAFLIFFAACAIFLLVASSLVDRTARQLPSYDRVDISKILLRDKSTWTDEDYETLMAQTGILSKAALDEIAPSRLAAFQDALYFEGEVRHDMIAPTTPHDELYDPATGKLCEAPIVNLQAGDILVTSTCHTFGWRNGHAALILSGGYLLHSVAPGVNSEVVSTANEVAVPWFRQAANFMVLRLKDGDAALRKAIADNAEEELTDVPYSLLVGIFMKKDQGTSPKATHCSHLVWQAYKNAGFDIDADGGPVCTTRDIAKSELLEVVQVYGFDPVKLW